ncbi:MAG TPA: hypothetical protein VLJ58_01435, partial [Ramlibacter sp.]|nr:hypothetical protein [Ramlibacter sp.]
AEAAACGHRLAIQARLKTKHHSDEPEQTITMSLVRSPGDCWLGPTFVRVMGIRKWSRLQFGSPTYSGVMACA